MNRIRFNFPLRNLTTVLSLSGSELTEALREREESGYQRGRADGERSLSEQLVRQRLELLELQQGVLTSLRQAMPEVRQDCEQSLVSLAFEVASRLVAGLPISAAMVEASIHEALSQVEEHTDYHVYLHPEDLELLQQMNSPVLLPNVAGQKIHFHRAPELSRGGCIVKTRFGLVDATRETKLELLQKAVVS